MSFQAWILRVLLLSVKLKSLHGAQGYEKIFLVSTLNINFIYNLFVDTN